MNTFQKFKNQHEQNNPLYIGNVWDVNSAVILENKNYKALGTSSAAIATSLGYDDGEEMSFNELVQVVKTIIARTSLPLTVDLEGGYSRNPEQICKNIMQLNELGVVGVNLEDSVVIDGERQIVDATEYSNTIKVIKKLLTEEGIEIFINVRTDFYIMGLDNPLKATLLRSTLYEKAGADGIFVPCVTDEEDIKEIVSNISIPLNVMAMPTLPSSQNLQQLGVKRVSTGPFMYNKINEYFNNRLDAIHEYQSFDPMFE
jgi:2-methylisocitrate lyase-like PEP mutase family enzyme